MQFSSFSKIEIGTQECPIVKNKIVFKQVEWSSCNDIQFVGLSASSIPFQPFPINLYKAEDVAHFKDNLSVQFNHGDEIYVAQSNNHNLLLTHHQVKRFEGGNIDSSPPIPIRPQFSDQEQLYEQINLIIPQPKQSYGVIFDGVCLSASEGVLVGVTFQNAHALTFRETEIRNCYFIGGGSGAIENRLYLGLLADLTDCIFSDFQQLKIQRNYRGFFFARNLFIKSKITFVDLSRFSQLTFIESQIQFEFNKTEIKPIVVSHSKFVKSSIQLAENATLSLTFERSYIENTSTFIQANKLVDLSINHSCFLSSSIFQNTSLETLYVHNSIFQGNNYPAYAFMFGAVDPGQQVFIELKNSIFAGYQKQIFGSVSYQQYDFDLYEDYTSHQYRASTFNVSFQSLKNDIFRMFKVPRLQLFLDGKKIGLPIESGTLLSPAQSADALELTDDFILDKERIKFNLLAFDHQPLFLMFTNITFQNGFTWSRESVLFTDLLKEIHQKKIYTLTPDKTIRFQLKGHHRNSFQNVEFEDQLIEKVEIILFEHSLERTIISRKSLEFISFQRAIKNVSIQRLKLDSSSSEIDGETQIIEFQFSDHKDVIWNFLQGVLTLYWWTKESFSVKYRITFEYCLHGQKMDEGLCVDQCPEDKTQFDRHCLKESKSSNSYILSSDGVFKTCPPNCLSCNLIYECRRCGEGYFIQNHYCYTRCSSGYFLRTNGWQCAPCRKYCLECEDEVTCLKESPIQNISIANQHVSLPKRCVLQMNNNLFGCLECGSEYQVINGICSQALSTNQDGREAISFSNTKCTVPCTDCLAEGEGCLSCTENYGLVQQVNGMQCVECPKFTFSIGIDCMPCTQSCYSDLRLYIIKNKYC